MNETFTEIIIKLAPPVHPLTFSFPEKRPLVHSAQVRSVLRIHEYVFTEIKKCVKLKVLPKDVLLGF
jgi:hypothetical protein